MSDRETQIIDFLRKNELVDAERIKLSGDASFRRYERIVTAEKSYMLMDAPPEKENIAPFINIDNYLRRRGLSAPEIFDANEKQGLMLLEDLGNDSFTDVLAGKSSLSEDCTEEGLYLAAIDVLVHLARSTLPRHTPDYDHALLLQECRLLIDWFLPNVNPEANTDVVRDEYLAIWEKLLDFQRVAEDVVVLRDFHADNLMWLPQRMGVENVGLLDFQDAVIGSPVYDLVSLLEDARRDVKAQTVQACIDRYLRVRKSIHREDFLTNYATLAAQRNCKIIGIFARLAIRDRKPRYISYMPRVWKHLEGDVHHPVLADLKEWLDRVIPPQLRKPEAFTSPNQKELAIG